MRSEITVGQCTRVADLGQLSSPHQVDCDDQQPCKSLRTASIEELIHLTDLKVAIIICPFAGVDASAVRALFVEVRSIGLLAIN